MRSHTALGREGRYLFGSTCMVLLQVRKDKKIKDKRQQQVVNLARNDKTGRGHLLCRFRSSFLVIVGRN